MIVPGICVPYNSKYPRLINFVMSVTNQQIMKKITHENPISSVSSHFLESGHTFIEIFITEIKK